MQEKKILLINFEYPPLGGGGGVNTQKLARGLVSLGYKVDVLSTWFKGAELYEEDNGIRIHRIKVLGRNSMETGSLISTITFPLLAYAHGVKLCKENRYEFLLSYFAVPSGTLGRFLAKRFKLPHLLNLVGGDLYEPTKTFSPHKIALLRYEVNKVMRSADHLVAISSDTAKRAYEYFNPPKEIEVIHIPYEDVKFEKKSRAELGLSADIFYTISIGRVVKRKGFDFLIKTVAKLPENIHSLIVGDGPEMADLQTLARNLGVADRVSFLGSLSDEQKYQYLQCADMYFLSSIHEGFGIVLQEAMQVGLPILSTDDGGQIDFIHDNENGFLIKFGDVDSAVEKINEIISNKSLVVSMRQKNETLMKTFLPKSIANRYLESIQKYITS